MERLTRCVGFRNGKPIYATNIDMRRIGAVDKLKDALGTYEDKQEQGLLIILPVAEETPVWRIIRHSGGGRVPDWYEKYETEFVLSMLLEWGITVFATEAEAEEALAKMGGANNG